MDLLAPVVQRDGQVVQREKIKRLTLFGSTINLSELFSNKIRSEFSSLKHCYDNKLLPEIDSSPISITP
jgi:tellurite resistance protein